ncbi:MAG TPA: PEP/pyruvate-binding domain-containing protein [Polyangiaceae bacterium]|nr:PEP/pyruvate-binding domain-containing protein [Polyangiaceae bacterium]
MSIVPLEAATSLAEHGGKAVHLGAALRAGLPVPGGVAVSVVSLARLVKGDPGETDALRRALASVKFPVACRSSAVDEDGEAASFAGQHATILNVTDVPSVLAALGEVHASAHTEAALAYRKKLGMTPEVRIAAVVQTLVDPESAGVLFTRHPVTGADERVVEAAWGLGEVVVQGLVTPDHYRVARDGRVLESRPGEKDLAIRRAPGGRTVEEDVARDLVNARCLDDALLRRLNDLATRAEAHFGGGLDLEWAKAGNDLHLLQARPISTGRR